jgi:hypothetical protein
VVLLLGLTGLDHPGATGVRKQAPLPTLVWTDTDSARPGRLHHCMRSIGVASRALDLLLQRVSDPARRTFGKYLREHGEFAFTVRPMGCSSS